MSELMTVPAQPVDNLARTQQFLATAIERGADPAALTQLLDLQERLLAAEAMRQANDALASMQEEVPPVPKGREVCGRDGKVMYHYAAIEDVVAHLKPFLRRHGFTVRFNSELLQESVESSHGAVVRQYQRAECIVTHNSGHSWSAYHKTPIDPKAAAQSDPQKGASAETYAKRRALMNAFGLVSEDEDDDGRRVSRAPANDAPASDESAPKAQPRGGRVKDAEVLQIAEKWAKAYGWGPESDRAERQAAFKRWAYETAAVPEAHALQAGAWSRDAMRTCEQALEIYAKETPW